MLIIHTGYPGGIYTIDWAEEQQTIIIHAKNSDPYKITEEEQKEFMEKILTNTDQIKNVYLEGAIHFKDRFVCLEDLRNIHYGIIEELIQDNSTYSTNKIGGFGFLCGNTKPYRLEYMKLCEKYPEMFDYLSTNKYSSTDSSMFSFIDFKKYKYLIDLPGHTYSTKLYSFLHSKRVIFKLKNVNKQHEFYWEKYLKQGIHYIEIEPDFSDLIEKYLFLENNPRVVNNIIDNCNEIIQTTLSQEKLISHFLEKIGAKI